MRIEFALESGFFVLGNPGRSNDSGRKQERLLSTSPLKPARAETLNVVRPVGPDEATCTVHNGTLQVVPTPLKVQGPDIAALSPPG